MATPRPQLGSEIATTGDGQDITRGFSGPILQPSDPVLALRGRGDFRIYEQILTDWQVGSCWQQRRLAVTSKEWEVIPGGDSPSDQAAADSLREQLHSVGWDNVTDKMLFGVFFGFAVAELVYARDGNQIVIDAIKVRNRRRFRFTPAGELRLLTLNQMTEGVPAPNPYFWHFATGADHDDEPYGLGIAHWLYWPTLFKRNGIKFWLVFLEKFGMPTAHGTFESGATAEDRQRLLDALEAIQTDSGIATPKSMEIELLEAARSGTADYDTLVDKMDGAIAKVILGQVASTEGTPGRLGNEDLQSDVRQDLIKADADLVCESFNQGPARWLTEWNFPGAAAPRVWRKIEVPEDLDSKSQRDERITNMGFRPSLDYVRETYGDGWEEAAVPPPVQFQEGDDLPEPRADIEEDQVDQLQDEGDRAVEDMVNQIRDEVIAARDFADLKRRLRELEDDMDTSRLTELLTDAMAAAHLAGRHDILEGA